MTIRPLARLPFEAPHAVEQVLAARAHRRANSGPRVTTTLDLDLQHILERQIARYIARSAPAASATPRRSSSTRATWASRRWSARRIISTRDLQGQVNGTLARRSPGSTLKPFIYALGFDQGMLHPQTVLRDVPTSFGPYTPENFDGRFLGPITATDALNRSRNIPAVWVASQLACARSLSVPAGAPASATWRARSITGSRWCSAAARSACRSWPGSTRCWSIAAC